MEVLFINDIKIGVVEMQFADLIWQNEPIASGDLVKLCEKQLHWKKSTTYTVLKKLCEKGIFQNENKVITSLINKEQYNSIKSKHFVEETFNGSLPAFIAAFTKENKKLSAQDLDEIRKMIDSIEL